MRTIPLLSKVLRVSGLATGLLLACMFVIAPTKAGAATGPPGTCFLTTTQVLNGAPQDSSDSSGPCKTNAPGVKGLDAKKCYHLTKTENLTTHKSTFSVPGEVNCSDGSQPSSSGAASNGSSSSQSGVQSGALPNPKADNNAIQRGLNIVFATAAAIALLIIVIGGFRYVLANGDARAVENARNAILYAIVGLLVTLAAFSVVNFVVQGVS